MISVSDAWKDVHQRFLLPETFIEIDCAITEEGAQEAATGSATHEEVFSNVDSILDNDENIARYATNELNLWALDGTRVILPDAASEYADAGYVSNIESTGSVTLSFPEIRESAVAGVTIAWSEEFGEYPSVFTVAAKNGGVVVAETTITDNTTPTSVVSLKLENYDSITVTVHSWGLPNRRVRIEKFAIGHVLTLTKSDILSFTHEQHGDLLSGELPKYSIEFTLDNSDDRWNPNNPTGMEQYLSERQKLTVRYGLDINGTIEWIKAGTFYLSEWDAPSNGLEARFVARDVFEYLMGTNTSKSANMSSTQYGNLSHIVTWAVSTDLPTGASVVVDPSLSASPGREFRGNGTYAEMVQKCANAACCILRYDRDGVLYIEPLNMTLTDYRITQALSYSHPEIKLSKHLKEVEVDYGSESPYSLAVAKDGEQQTVSNDYIYTSSEAEKVARWVRGVLTNRKTVNGEFRADPRLDLYDIVTVESKYGALTPVAITSIKYIFDGSFRCSYSGRVLEATT